MERVRAGELALIEFQPFGNPRHSVGGGLTPFQIFDNIEHISYNYRMKLTTKVKLQPEPEQYQALLKTLETANTACNQISNVAWQNNIFSQFKIHKLVYYDIKEQFELTAQVVVRCISKVADAYKLDKKTKRSFKPYGAIAYDARILRWYVDKQEVSIWTVGGRKRIPFVCGPRQLELLQNQRGESDLALIDGEFYLFATCEVETPELQDVEDVLGVDLGIKNIATTSDGEKFAGNHLNNVRRRRRRQRKKIQAVGTKSARRKLKKLSGKEKRFATHTNHVISKQIVEQAQRTKRAIALEELKGIRDRVRARKSQRDDLHSWSFRQLGEFIKYKAEWAGVPVIFVDPRYTSQECSVCGHIDKRNRKTQEHFQCLRCGHVANADIDAARVIASRAAVSLPIVSDARPVGLA